MLQQKLSLLEPLVLALLLHCWTGLIHMIREVCFSCRAGISDKTSLGWLQVVQNAFDQALYHFLPSLCLFFMSSEDMFHVSTKMLAKAVASVTDFSVTVR